MSVFRSRDLPGPGGTRRAPRRVSWPAGMTPSDWVCLAGRPSLLATHWCPGLAQKGRASRGRSAPCFAVNCERCKRPREFPPQEILAFCALDPNGHLTTCMLPGHLADDVAADRAWSGQWRGTILTVSRAHQGTTAGVQLVAVDTVDASSLPMPWDHTADLALLWAPFLEGRTDDFVWHNYGDRNPGEEG